MKKLLIFALVFVLILAISVSAERGADIMETSVRSDSLNSDTELVRAEPTVSKTEGRVLLTIDGNTFSTDAKTTITVLPEISEYICGVSRDDKIVCQVTPSDGAKSRGADPTLWCWGKGELRECPDEEIISVAECRSLGRMKCNDVTLERISESEEIDILSWSWGVAESSSATDVDDDKIELSYVWTISGKSGNSSDRPTESVSFNFEKIKIEYSTGNNDSGGTIEVELPEMRVAKDSLIFTTVLLGNRAVKDNGQYCGTTNHLLTGGDCNDEDVSRPPGDSERQDPLSQYGTYDGTEELIYDEERVNSSNSEKKAMFELQTANDELKPWIAEYRNWSAEERGAVGDYVRDVLQENRLTGQDFALAIAYYASENDNVENIIYDENEKFFVIEHKEQVRFLGFIPMKVKAKTKINSEGEIETDFKGFTSLLSVKPLNPCCLLPAMNSIPPR